MGGSLFPWRGNQGVKRLGVDYPYNDYSKYGVGFLYKGFQLGVDIHPRRRSQVSILGSSAGTSELVRHETLTLVSPDNLRTVQH
jgi:hypothetical protein